MTRYEADIAQGHVHLLRYAPDTGNLFFTTSLQNAVCAYSLKDNKLLAPSCEHPSPPTVIAVSSDSHWLLSASVAPPTILLNNLLFNTPVRVIHPQCSSAAVVAADFHPQRANIFSLAFADGVCAIYDVAHLVPIIGRGAYSRISGEISHVKGLHAIVSSTPLSNIEMSSLGPGIECANPHVGERGIRIAAVALVPGSKAKAVTIGADGKCCVVNFFTGGKKIGSVMRSWHVQGPATSLALLSFSSKAKADHIPESYANGLKKPRRRVLVAIGRQDGIVLLYDLGGHLLRDREFSLDGSRIIELEWASNRVSLEPGQPDPDLAIPSLVAFQQKRRSVGELPGSVVPTAGIVPVIDGANDKLGVSLLDSLARIEPIQEPTRQGYWPQPAVNHLDCPNLATPQISHREEPTTSKNEDVLSDSKQPKSGKLQNSKPSRGNVAPVLHPGGDVPLSSDTLPGHSLLPPPVPPRPVKRKARGPSSPNAEKRDLITSGAGTDSRLDPQRALDDLGAPRGLPWSSQAKRLDVIAMNHAAAERERGSYTVTKDKDQVVLPTALVDDDKNGWMDITASSRRQNGKLNGKPARIEKRKDRKGSSALQPPSSMVSEASNDIVVDWSPASTQLVVPSGSLLPHRLPEIPPRAAKCRKKAPKDFSLSNDTVVQWSSFKKGHIFAMRNQPVVRKSQPPPSSSSISPNNERSATTSAKPNFLAETTYDRKQPPRPVVMAEIPLSPAPPSRPPPPPPTTLESTKPDDEHSSDHLRFQNKINILRDEIALRFHVQNTWIEAQLKDLSEESRKIEEENRRLKGEVGNVRAKVQTEKRA